MNLAEQCKPKVETSLDLKIPGGERASLHPGFESWLTPTIDSEMKTRRGRVIPSKKEVTEASSLSYQQRTFQHHFLASARLVDLSRLHTVRDAKGRS